MCGTPRTSPIQKSSASAWQECARLPTPARGCLSGLQAVVMTFQVPVPKEPKEPKEPKVMACALRSSLFFSMVLCSPSPSGHRTWGVTLGVTQAILPRALKRGLHLLQVKCQGSTSL